MGRPAVLPNEKLVEIFEQLKEGKGEVNLTEPCTLHLKPCTLHPAPCTLHPAP
jgi:hypothetical protein